MPKKVNSEIKKFPWVPVIWMKLDPALQSEASQKEKSKYSILTPMYGIGNNGTDEPIFQEGLETQMQRMEEGGSGTNGDSSINICTLPCVGWLAGVKLLYSTGSPGWCSLMPRGIRWGRGGSERIYVKLWLIFIVAGRNQHSIVKKIFFFKNKFSFLSFQDFGLFCSHLLILLSISRRNSEYPVRIGIPVVSTTWNWLYFSDSYLLNNSMFSFK